MFITQFGKASTMENMKNVTFHYLLLVLFFVVFIFRTLLYWFLEKVEEKSHDHFYNGINELRLSNLALVRQGHDESIFHYVKKFQDIIT